MSLSLCPIDREEARAFIKAHHRHLEMGPSWKFGVAVHDGEEIVGVIVVGRPVARHEDDGRTLEVTRCCVLEGRKNASSMLYGAARRAAWALGYRRLVTLTLQSESGASMRASGFRLIGERPDRNWNSPGRPRVEINTGPKFKWETTP